MHRGVAEVFAEKGHNELTLDDLAAWQFYFEVAHVNQKQGSDPMGCTSVLALDEHNVLHHGYNMDVPSADDFRFITAHVRWMRRGHVVFETVQGVAENVGVSAGVSALSDLSFSYNWRTDSGDRTIATIDELLKCVHSGAAQAPLANSVREVFEAAISGSHAASIYRAAPLCAPTFITVGAADKGAIITRNSTAVLNLRVLANTTSGAWHVSQANTDVFKPQPPADDRLHLAEQVFDKLGRRVGASKVGVWAVMSTPGNSTMRGVLNDNTVFTAYMRPHDATMEDTLRGTEDWRW